MSRKAGTLLWSRRRLTIPPGAVDIDTGLTQLNRNFADQSPNEPTLGLNATSPPPLISVIPSRVQVIPQSPLAEWITVGHSDPYLNTNTNTVQIQFVNLDNEPHTVNVLFWDPHTVAGPGQAQAYNPTGF